MRFIIVFFCISLSQNFAAENRVALNGKDLFMAGMNLAWMDFANDIADEPLNENKMRRAIQDIRDAGGNALRWWLFTNASKSPTFDAQGLANGIGKNTVANVKKALDIAEENGVVISLCLLSFDLMQEGQVGSWNHMSIANNVKLMTTDAGIQAFVDNAVIPLVKGVGKHPAIMCWEVFNEPEGMTREFGWTNTKVGMADVQKMTNRVAAAVHETVPGLFVSSGTHSFHANSDVPSCGNCKNYYSDAELIKAGGKANGTLDFYQVHYYPQHFDDDRNPFAHPASYWKLDKPIVIGEFPAGSWDKSKYPRYRSTKSIIDAFKHAYDAGYAGAMSWDYNGFKDEIQPGVQDIKTTAPALTALFDNHKADILIKEVTRAPKTGDGVMEVKYAAISTNDGASIERVQNYNWQGKSKLLFDAKITAGTAPLSFRTVLKTGNNWDWRQTENFCEVKPGGNWTTCQFDLNSHTHWQDTTQKADLGQVKAILIQTFSEEFEGSVYFNNIRADTEVFDNFDTEFDVWGVAGGMKGGESIQSIKSVYIDPSHVFPQIPYEYQFRFYSTTNMTEITGIKNGRYRLKISDMLGRVVSYHPVSAENGTAHMDLSGLKQGIYYFTLFIGGNPQTSMVLFKKPRNP